MVLLYCREYTQRMPESVGEGTKIHIGHNCPNVLPSDPYCYYALPCSSHYPTPLAPRGPGGPGGPCGPALPIPGTPWSPWGPGFPGGP